MPLQKWCIVQHKVELVNEKYNELNSGWLKDNAKKYGYRYSIIKGGS